MRSGRWGCLHSGRLGGGKRRGDNDNHFGFS
jgi:hypothetical protein